jgi:hypothetical protein
LNYAGIETTKQIAGLLNEELNDIFRRIGLNMIEGDDLDSQVKITPIC